MPTTTIYLVRIKPLVPDAAEKILTVMHASNIVPCINMLMPLVTAEECRRTSTVGDFPQRWQFVKYVPGGVWSMYRPVEVEVGYVIVEALPIPDYIHNKLTTEKQELEFLEARLPGVPQ